MDYFREYKHLFQKPWCPIYGDAPRGGFVDSDPLKEFGEIINSARLLFGIAYDIAEFSDSNYPNVEEIEEMLLEDHLTELSVNDVVMIRDIFDDDRCITQYTANNEKGVAIEGGPIHRFVDLTIHIAKTMVNPRLGGIRFHPNAQKYWYKIENAPDHWILAALAIKAAYNQTCKFVLYDEPIDFSKAYALLGAAKEVFHKSEYDELNEDFETLLEKESVAQQRRSEGGLTKAEKFWNEKGITPEGLQDLADKIWKDKPDLTKSAVAKSLSKRIGIAPDTIRKKISKK